MSKHRNMWDRDSPPPVQPQGQGSNPPTAPDPTINALSEGFRQLGEVIANVSSLQRSWLQRALDPRRNINEECGYPQQDITPEDYQYLYERDAIAARVVEMFPKETWKTSPVIYEVEEADQVTPFEKAWREINLALISNSPDRSWFKDEEGSPIWEYLLRADILSGIGSYGVVFLGLSDGSDPSTPAKKGSKLLFMRVFPQYLASISRYNSDPANPRFGMPEEYSITFNDPREAQSGGVQSQGMSTNTVSVHWSRIIHVADNRMSSEIFGIPRCKQVYNRLYDLQKVYGASSEGYWQAGFPILSVESNPVLGGDVKVNIQAMKEEYAKLFNSLQRAITLIGFQAKTIAPAVVDPTAHINAALDAICIQKGWPKRIFVGSERGELASSQDQKAWDKRVAGRRCMYVIPKIIVPFVDRMIILGILPEPAHNGGKITTNEGYIAEMDTGRGYSIHWPDENVMTDAEQATIAQTKTTALSTYVKDGVEAIMPPLPFLTSVMGYDDEEAQAIVDEAEEILAEQADEEERLRQEDIEQQRQLAEKQGQDPNQDSTKGPTNGPPKPTPPNGPPTSA